MPCCDIAWSKRWIISALLRSNWHNNSAIRQCHLQSNADIRKSPQNRGFNAKILPLRLDFWLKSIDLSIQTLKQLNNIYVIYVTFERWTSSSLWRLRAFVLPGRGGAAALLEHAEPTRRRSHQHRGAAPRGEAECRGVLLVEYLKVSSCKMVADSYPWGFQVITPQLTAGSVELHREDMHIAHHVLNHDLYRVPRMRDQEWNGNTEHLITTGETPWTITPLAVFFSGIYSIFRLVHL